MSTRGNAIVTDGLLVCLDKYNEDYRYLIPKPLKDRNHKVKPNDVTIQYSKIGFCFYDVYISLMLQNI